MVFSGLYVSFCLIYLQTLLKELEEFAFKGIPDVRGSTVQDAQILEEMVIHYIGIPLLLLVS